MVQNRFETKAGIYNPVSFLKNINARVAYTDYEHVELEAGRRRRDSPTVVSKRAWKPCSSRSAAGTARFRPAVRQQRFRRQGRRGVRTGYRHKEHRPVRAAGKAVRPLKLELGGRHDQVKLDPNGDYRRRTFGPFVPPPVCRRYLEAHTMPLTCASAWTAQSVHPPTKSCYAAGAHIATRSLEIGDANLKTERGQRVRTGHPYPQRSPGLLRVGLTRPSSRTSSTSPTRCYRRPAGPRLDPAGRGVPRRRGRSAGAPVRGVAPVTGICACSATT